MPEGVSISHSPLEDRLINAGPSFISSGASWISHVCATFVNSSLTTTVRTPLLSGFPNTKNVIGNHPSFFQGGVCLGFCVSGAVPNLTDASLPVSMQGCFGQGTPS